ncbi:hypothetical protein DW243_13760 [Mediterraneibacter gnavus]|uniref:Uncharacterized protein n=1 Tax=Mediterraneibacter gnavus TaxID=33038 RepID=A0A3E4UV37_MEDGN|nr:hypothetical protein DXC31_16630 [Mediterraneibacter gnavus]RHD03607.1 hypothetical protein DW812_13405 [Mediterraneibacter gnavus]RHG69857.1 hypothetical protein DW248_13125 [Mediterraneibacter gnavus]RHG81292.1 hypothetical protein DW243_13760 [Mediterraneibacter gnavus]
MRRFEKYNPHILFRKTSANWYNYEESHLEQFHTFQKLLFLPAKNVILHLRIISYSSQFPILLSINLFTEKRPAKAERIFLFILYYPEHFL